MQALNAVVEEPQSVVHTLEVKESHKDSDTELAKRYAMKFDCKPFQRTLLRSLERNPALQVIANKLVSIPSQNRRGHKLFCDLLKDEDRREVNAFLTFVDTVERYVLSFKGPNGQHERLMCQRALGISRAL